MESLFSYPIVAIWIFKAADYLLLFNETIGSIVSELDGTRPYLLSSPSNGIEAEKSVFFSYTYHGQKFYTAIKRLTRFLSKINFPYSTIC